jgi:hypothetical protein
MCAYFCYQDLGDDVYKYTNGHMLHVCAAGPRPATQTNNQMLVPNMRVAMLPQHASRQRLSPTCAS